MTDAVGFVPAGIFFRQGAGLINPGYEATSLDPLKQGRLITYPPLFPWVVGALMPTTEPSAAFVVIAGLRALSLCGFLFLLGRAFRRAGIQEGAFVALASVAALLGLCTG